MLLRISNEDKVIEATCNYCPEVGYDKYMIEASRRGLRGKVLTSAQSYRSPVTYIHKPTLARHVGNEKSFHHWCKKEVLVSEGKQYVPPKSVTDKAQQRVDVGITNASGAYYEKLFRTILYLVEEELAFTKLKGLMELQMRNGIPFGTVDKVNNKSCREMVDIISEVIMDIMKGYFEKGNFLSMSGDASEARKTAEEKELVFGKLLVNGHNGFVPCTFLLKCQSLKEFGGGTAEGTFQAMHNAVTHYVEENRLKEFVLLQMELV